MVAQCTENIERDDKSEKVVKKKIKQLKNSAKSEVLKNKTRNSFKKQYTWDNKMPFPLHVPKQMPCEHWNHFPVNTVLATIATVSGSPPPTPEQMPYCKICRAQEKRKSSSWTKWGFYALQIKLNLENQFIIMAIRQSINLGQP